MRLGMPADRTLIVVLALLSATVPARGGDDGFLGKPVSAWLEELRSPDAKVRRGAAFALGKCGADAAYTIARLSDTLRDDRDPSVREAAAFAIGEIAATIKIPKPLAQQAFEALLAKLARDSDPRVRRGAANALGLFGPRAAAAAEDLQKTLLRDPDASVRQNAAWALGKLGSRSESEMVSDLCTALSDKDPLVRRDVAEALGELKREARMAAPLLMKRFQDASEDETVRKSALNALVNVVGPEDRRLTNVFDRLLKHKDAEVVRAAALALGNIGGAAAVPALPVLRTALADSDAIVRRQAAAALANIGPEAAVAVSDLSKALADQDPEVRRNAALALGRIGPRAEASVPVLIRLLSPSEPDEVRLYATEALAHIGAASESATPALLEVLRKDQVPRVRQRAVWALARMRDFEEPAIIQALASTLNETESEHRVVRYEAARYLALRLGAKAPDKVLDVLAEMLDDQSLTIYTRTDAQVSRTGTEASGGDTTVTANVSGDGRCLPAEALGHLGARVRDRPEIVRTLKKLAKEKDLHLREAATTALRKIGEK